MNVIQEAIRFSEEYGFNRWQEARDAAAELEGERDELRQLLRAAYDALFFGAGLTPRQRDDMRRALPGVPADPPARDVLERADLDFLKG